MTGALRFLSVFLVGLAASLSGQQPRAVELTFLDVGQGDAILIRSPEGKVALVDAGPGSIARLLKRHEVDTIDIAIATHPHADHIGGMAEILRTLPVRYYMDNGVPHSTATYRNVMSALAGSTAQYLRAEDRTIRLGSVDLVILPPPSAAADHNLRSIGIIVAFGQFRAMLTGDAEIETLNYFMRRGVPQVTVLKAGHHGSRDAVSPAWLSATKPRVVVISCGRDNPYGHPDPWALRYYEATASEVHRTDLEGEITVTAQPDGVYAVRTDRASPGPPDPVRDGRPARSAGNAAAVGLVASVFADAPGNDHYNLNGEYVVLRNGGTGTFDMVGWTACDAARHCYTFPPGTSLAPGDSLVLYTGAGRDDGHRFFMNRRQAVWNNGGDILTVRDRAGNLMIRYVY